MNVSVRANVRTARPRAPAWQGGLTIAFRSGAITGMLVAGLALLGVSGYFYVLTGPMRPRPQCRDRHRRAGRARLRRLADLDLRPSRRRHLHQGRRRRRRPGRQGRGRHPRGRSPQPRHHRRQRRRQCRRLRRHGRRPVRDLCVTTVATMVLAAIFFAARADPDLTKLMTLPLAIGGVCIVTSIIGTFFVRLGQAKQHHGRALQGPDRHRRAVDRRDLFRHPICPRRSQPTSPHRRQGRAVTGMNLFWCGSSASPSPALIVWITEYYTGTNYRPVSRSPAPRSHRPRHQRHPGPRRLAGIDGAAGARHLRRHHRHLPARRPVRHRHRGDRDAGAGRHGRRARRLRSGHRQCRRHRRNGGPAQGGPRPHRRARRGRQHHQGGDQGLCDRLGRPRRAGAVRAYTRT
jgi:hypothetical protein